MFEGDNDGMSLKAAEQLISSPHQSRQTRHASDQVSSLIMETLGKKQVSSAGECSQNHFHHLLSVKRFWD